MEQACPAGWSPRPQLSGGGGSCPSDSQHLLEACCLLCALLLSLDLLETEGRWSPSPPSHGQGQPGVGGRGPLAERGTGRYRRLSSKSAWLCPATMRLLHCCLLQRHGRLLAVLRRGPSGEGRPSRSQARSPVPLAIPPAGAHAAPSEGLGGRLWEPGAGGHRCRPQKGAAMWRAPRSAYIRGPPGRSVHRTRSS